MFIDKAKIHLKAGKGGDGAVAFRREAHVPAGGPAGGDGGKGGDIIFKVDEGMRTLMDFRYKKHYSAADGEAGKGKNMYGKDGEDLLLKVPPGTIIREETTGHIIADLTGHGDTVVVVRGGQGGKGNTHFKTSTRQAPRFATPGESGQELTVILELKLIADVGLIGFPNVGKSTLLSVVTGARPKIANYHFTTLTPNLGVVQTKYGDSFVLADIPGLIEGAHEGTGLGHEFLRHVERTKLLIHVLDVAGLEGRDPLEDFKKINEELYLYNKELAKKPQVVAANKMDLSSDVEFEKLKSALTAQHVEIFPISAVTNKGIDKLLGYVSERLRELEEVHKETVIEKSERIYRYEEPEDRHHFTIYIEDGVYVVEGIFIKRLIDSTDFDDMESLSYFQKVLKNRGVIDKLKKLGMSEGDSVKMCGIEFEHFE